MTRLLYSIDRLLRLNPRAARSEPRGQGSWAPRGSSPLRAFLLRQHPLQSV